MLQPTTRPSLWRTHTLGVLTFGLILRAGSMAWMRDLIRTARHDAWIAVLGAASLSLFMGTLFASAVSLYPEAQPGLLFQTAFGRLLGGILSLVYVLFNLAEAARSTRIAVAMIQFAVLHSTPTWILILVSLLIAAVLLGAGVEAVLQYQFTLFWPTLILAVLSLGLGLRFADWVNILPVLGHGARPVVQGVGTLVDGLGGFQLGFVYIPYFLQQGLTPAQVRRGVWGGTILVNALYLYATVVLLVGFGPYEVEWMTWPAMESVRRTYLSGLFFERLDIVFLITLLIATTCALTFFSHASLETLRQLLPGRRHWWQVVVCLALVLVLGSLPHNLEQTEQWGVLVLRPIGLVYQVVIPILLLGIGLVRRRRRDARA